jgi:hypothetical protein
VVEGRRGGDPIYAVDVTVDRGEAEAHDPDIEQAGIAGREPQCHVGHRDAIGTAVGHDFDGAVAQLTRWIDTRKPRQRTLHIRLNRGRPIARNGSHCRHGRNHDHRQQYPHSPHRGPRVLFCVPHSTRELRP